jgi:hypothetical protein
MQQDADTTDYPALVNGGANECVPSPTGPGGSLIQVNQNEAEILEASYENTSVVQIGWAADDASVQGAFREQAL